MTKRTHRVGTRFGIYPDSDYQRITTTDSVVIDALTFRRGGAGGGSSDHAVAVIGANNVTITNCDFDGPPSCIYLQNCTGTVDIRNCRFRAPAGPSANYIQLSGCTMQGRITGNKGLGGVTEDMINMFNTTGVDVDNQIIIENNHLHGVGWTSTSGCGINIGDFGGGYITVQNNTLLNPAQCGIGVSGGSYMWVLNNTMYTYLGVPNSNVGISCWNQGGPATIDGTIHVRDNTERWWRPDGTRAGYYDAGNMGTIDLSGNNFDQAGMNPILLEVTL